MDQRVEERRGHGGGGRRGLQRHFLRPEKGSDSGPEVSLLVPVWRLEGGGRTTSQCLAGTLSGCVCPVPVHRSASLNTTKGPTHTHTHTRTYNTDSLVLRFNQGNPEARCDPSLTGPASCFLHFRARKHLLFTRPTPPTHAHTQSSGGYGHTHRSFVGCAEPNF